MANKLFFLLLCLLGLFISTYLGEAAQCATDKKSLCTAHCNGTSFELSKAFDFPIKITEPTPRGDDGSTFWYTWNPCHIEECPGYSAGTDIAVCQKADHEFYSNCGEASQPIWLMDTTRPSAGETFPNWHVQYISGSFWRVTIIKFIVDHTVKEPTIKFISEEPHLQYNFEVRGKCIGQDSYDCQQYYESRNKVKKQ
ncbi:uncharacterized protein LOC135343748 [Halichondria panicea]|uniref:uncharacterized protein LOC135343748 n=1 Tax=Halichondria panicea TaxID=6063 RepID=UPI00312B9DBE